MARLNRLVVAGLPHHVSHRAVAGGRLFADAVDRELFLQVLRRCSSEHGVVVHAYVLLEHEVQLLLTPVIAEDLGRMMQALSRFYVPAFNRRHGRAGALWQGRFRSAPVGGGEPLLTCVRYLEQAPARAGWVGAVEEYAWSSAAHHVGVRVDPLLTRLPADSGYWRLGNTPFERDAAYRALLARPLTAKEASAVEASTLKGWALGSGEFLARVTSTTGRRATVNARGRPKREA
jgi:putative transposase